VNLCRSCGLDFASMAAFDRHRSRVLSKEHSDGHRCLTESELHRLGWEQNQHGRWVHSTALRNRPQTGSYLLTEGQGGRERTPDPPAPNQASNDDECRSSRSGGVR
jgi:hypothetical protein